MSPDIPQISTCFGILLSYWGQPLIRGDIGEISDIEDNASDRGEYYGIGNKGIKEE
jgi:hypothetical protein